MVYRFDEQGHGEVFSEEREPELEAFLGNHYPASDIPQIARRLYVRNRVRVLEDVEYLPVPLTPARSPLDGQQLDMSLCYLRSMSPIHIQYLKNMGVAATLVSSLLVGGRLWGLVSCHHYSPRTIQYEVRVACELLAESVATRISALQSFAQAQAELSVRRLEQRMIEAISRRGRLGVCTLRQPRPGAPAARGLRGRALLRRQGGHRRRGPGHRPAQCAARMAGCPAALRVLRHLFAGWRRAPVRKPDPGGVRAIGRAAVRRPRGVSGLAQARAGAQR